MILKNREVKKLADFLMNEELNGKLSRLRTRFIKILNIRLKEIEEFRIEIVEKYAKKDDKGNPIINGGVYEMEDMESFNKEFSELMDEKLIIDETESQREILLGVKQILESTQTKFKGVDAFLYDSWCEAFEQIKHEETKSE